MSIAPRRSREQGIMAWDPFRELEQMYQRMGRLLDPSLGEWPAAGAWVPPADVEETDDGWTVEAELPGVKKEDVNVQVQDRELLIEGEFKERERKGTLRRSGRRTGRFEYRVVLPGDLDPGRVEATLADGVLTVRVPKSPQAQPKKVEVKVGSRS
jgi:HSP20 family protein